MIVCCRLIDFIFLTLILFHIPLLQHLQRMVLFSQAKCSFSVNPLMRTCGLSPKALHGLMENFAEIGSCYRQLNRFTQHHSERMSGYSGGKCLEAFVASLRKYLETYKYALMQIQGIALFLYFFSFTNHS